MLHLAYFQLDIVPDLCIICEIFGASIIQWTIQFQKVSAWPARYHLHKVWHLLLRHHAFAFFFFFFAITVYKMCSIFGHLQHCGSKGCIFVVSQINLITIPSSPQHQDYKPNTYLWKLSRNLHLQLVEWELWSVRGNAFPLLLLQPLHLHSYARLQAVAADQKLNGSSNF